MKLLETHGCQGGGTTGYRQAGWDVTVVDIAERHRKYHPAGEYIIADAASYIRRHGHKYAGIHTSPACQWYTRGNASGRAGRNGTRWHRSIPPIREALATTGRPYVIENVKDAVWDMRNPIMLCGCMFDLHATDTDGETIYLHRKRLFELGGWDIPGLVKQSITIKGEEFAVRSPRECDHSHHRQVAGVYGGARRDKYEARMIRHGGYVPADKGVASALMGIVHAMSWEGLYEALPPSYTNYIGTELGKVVSS